MKIRHAPAARRQALGAILGLAMGLSNLLGYLMVLLLTRTLGPADFGGYTALSTYGVLLAIPAGAFQVVIARRLSKRDGPLAERTSGVRSAAVLGLALFGATVVMSPLLAHAFHVSSAWSAVFLGGMLPPMMVTGSIQGILLGTHGLQRLSVLYLVTAASRVVVALLAARFGWSVESVFAGMLCAALLTVAFGIWLVRDQLRVLPASGHRLIAEMVRSNSTLAAYVALTNVDILLARHFLTPHASGGYALASTFARAMCWGTQFIALIIVPRMHTVNATRTLLRASTLVLLIGAIGAGLIAIDPKWFITVAGGPQFGEYGHLALICVGLGVAWAIAQLWLFSEMGSNSGALGVVTWSVIGVEVAVIWLWAHDSPGQIVAVCLIGALLIAGLGFQRVLRRHNETDTPSGDELLVAADPSRS